jgi:S-formylglutathione hydrolase FrmB
MAVCEIKFFSKALQKATAATVILPENDFKPPFPTLYLLHGLSDDHTIWQRRTSIERYVSNLPFIVVMPDSGRGFYCDAEVGMAWESAIVRDLVGYIDTLFRTNATREGRCLAGLSMGGYGAVKLALKFPDLFCSAVSHSGAVSYGHLPIVGDGAWEKECRNILGENPVRGENDPFALAERLPKEQRPALRIDCGVDDFLIEYNRDFHAHLTKIGYPHEYEEFPGAHTWDYWDTHVQEAIAFHAKNMKL